MKGTLGFVSRISIAWISLLWISLVSAQPSGLSFNEALGKAHQMESELAQEDEYRLFMAQGEFLGKAIPVCINKTGNFAEKFTVVVSLEASGAVSQLWHQPENAFVACFANEIKRQFSYIGDKAPFFTAIEYSTNN